MRAFILIVVATALVYGQAVSFELLTGDDSFNWRRNPHLNPPGFENLARIWSESYLHLYIPVVMSAWWLLKNLTIMFPAVPDASLLHLVNVIVHSANAFLVFQLLYCRLRAQIGSALMGALLFALHPMQVEAVAWATGLKDLLSGLLGFGALSLLLKSLEEARIETSPAGRQLVFRVSKEYVLASVLFVFSMLAKPSMTVLPLAVFVLQACRGAPAVLLGVFLAPWFLLALASALLTATLQVKSSIPVLPVTLRPVAALDNLMFYLSKVLIPTGISAEYGRRAVERAHELWFWLSAAFGGAVFAAAYQLRGRYCQAVGGLGFFASSMLPMLGLVPFVHQFYSDVCDRYVYLAMFGIAIFGVAILERTARQGLMFVRFTCVSVLVALALLSFSRVGDWRNDDVYYSAILRSAPPQSHVHSNYGLSLYRRGKVQEAVSQFKRAIEINPRDEMARSNLLMALASVGNFKEAARNQNASYERGFFLLLASEVNEGIREIASSLRLDQELRAKRFRFEDESLRGIKNAGSGLNIAEVRSGFELAKRELGDVLAIQRFLERL